MAQNIEALSTTFIGVLQDWKKLSLNALKVYRRDRTIFIPLPEPLWRSSGLPGQCKCGTCNGSGMFDTLAIAEHDANDARVGYSFTWMVHYPSLQNGKL